MAYLELVDDCKCKNQGRVLMETPAQISKQKIICFIATFYLILMNQQYVPIEGDLVSDVKVVAMCLSPVVFFLAVPYFSRAFLWGLVYVAWLFATMYLRFDTPRLETLGYSVMFIGCYIMFYNLVYRGAFTLDYFQKVMRYFLWVYIIVLMIQQIVSVAGMMLPEINLGYDVGEDRLKVPSLSLEPSHSARIMAAMFFAFLKVTELIDGAPVTLKLLFSKYRKLTLCFLYAMISMYSGTAILMLVLVSFYFFQRQQVFYMIPIFIVVIIFVGDTEYRPAQRAIDTTESVLTLEANEVIETDNSAAARITPVMNAFKMDFSDSKTWFGHGTDSSRMQEYLSEKQTIWTDRGIVCYVFGLCLIFFCAVRPIISLPTLMVFCAFGGQILNVYYVFGLLMIFTCVSYFIATKKKQEEQSEA